MLLVRDRQTTGEDRGTQLLIYETLSLAKSNEKGVFSLDSLASFISNP